MKNTPVNSRFSQHTALTVGFLFIFLGVSQQSETSWLFTLAGALALIQALFIKKKR